MPKVDLTWDEIELLDSALDSYEYWEYRDELPHSSGYITILDDEDFAEQIKEYHEDEHEAMKEAWRSVKTARALADKLNAVRRDENIPETTS